MKKLALTTAALMGLFGASAQAASIGTDVYGLMNNAANVYYQDTYQDKHHYRLGVVTTAGVVGFTAHYRGLLPESGAFKPYWELGVGVGNATAVLGNIGITLNVAEGVAVEPYFGFASPGTSGIGINLAYELK